jgi:[ribosomal protein S18]-alanine N-acetyltransferase
MLLTKSMQVRPVTLEDQRQLASMIHFETRVHRHLDWRPPLEWLGHWPYLVAVWDDKPVAVLVCPPDPPDVAWIRLFAVASGMDVGDAWNVLWAEAQQELLHRNVPVAAAIPFQDWFSHLLRGSGFDQVHKVVMMSWEDGQIPPIPVSSTVRVRPMTLDDLAAVAEVDALSFGPIWRNSLDSLQLAFRQAAIATIAEDDFGILGYQISTANPLGGHLARLAVRPAVQRQGIGCALVCDLLDQFKRRGALRVTVNTQMDNLTSQSLYQKLSFRPTGEEYPVYRHEIK